MVPGERIPLGLPSSPPDPGFRRHAVPAGRNAGRGRLAARHPPNPAPADGVAIGHGRHHERTAGDLSPADGGGPAGHLRRKPRAGDEGAATVVHPF